MPKLRVGEFLIWTSEFQLKSLEEKTRNLFLSAVWRLITVYQGKSGCSARCFAVAPLDLAMEGKT